MTDKFDLLILAADGLHLVELKYYSGRLRGNDQTWLRDGRAAEDSPLRLANRKAKRLRTCSTPRPSAASCAAPAV
mgnify:CR=1 FL=1